MLKKSFIVLLCLIVLFTFSSCGSKAPSLSCQDSIASIERTESFSSDLQDIPEKLILKYINLDESWYTSIAMKLDTSKVTCDQLIFINAKDTNSLNKIKDAILAYRDNMIEDYRDYIPEEVPKLKAAIIKNQGLQLAFIVAEDISSVEKSLTEMWK